MGGNDPASGSRAQDARRGARPGEVNFLRWQAPQRRERPAVPAGENTLKAYAVERLRWLLTDARFLYLHSGNSMATSSGRMHTPSSQVP